MYPAIIGIIVVALVIFGIAYMIVMRADTIPLISTEGFADVAAAPGLDGAARILTALEPACTSDKYAELKFLLAKMAAFKTDLQSASGTINATMYMPLMASQDREQVAQTVGRCHAKTVPARELDLILDLWKDRGEELIRDLVAEAGVAQNTAAALYELFASAWNDVYDVAKRYCIPGSPDISKESSSPRDYVGITPDVGMTYVS
jgi:hypothetical protein